jgi:hypothetical protein
MEGADGLVVGVLRHAIADESQVCAARWSVRMGLGSERKHDAVSSPTAAREGPVKISVVLAVGDQILASTGNNLPLKSLISTQAVAR